MREYTVCNAGDRLSSEQARILKLFGLQQAKFKLNMIAAWSKDDESFKMLREDIANEENNSNAENNDDMDDDAEEIEVE